MGRKREQYNYNYEPDKVKAAQIEKQKAIMIAKIEQENIELDKSAKIEIIQANANFQLDIMKAKEQGFTRVIESLMEMMREWNLISEQRIVFLSSCKAETVEKINRQYLELMNDIDDSAFDFQINKQPQLFEKLEEFSGTESYETYKNSIEQYISNFLFEKSELLKSYRLQQELLVKSSLESFDVINNEITQLVTNRIDSLTLAINCDSTYQEVIESKQEKQKLILNDN
ncbi:hypothetical protein JEZ13_12215 [bacterium]|nr:hypothetical protein [bacterium]